MSRRTNALPTSMVAWQHHPSFLSPESFPQALQLNQLASVPALKKNSTLVKVLTAGLNPVDYKLGAVPVLSRLMLGSTAVPGIDYVGRVWATNLPESAGIKAGDLVFGTTAGPGPTGTLAAFTVISGTDGLIKVPEEGGLELDWLGGAGVGSMTAYQSLVGELEDSGPGSAQGKSVLINGGSGGVGTYGVQIAKAIGCENIVVTCSSANADLVSGLGATEVIDYRSTNIVEASKAWAKKAGKPFDLIVDNAGADMNLYWHCHEYLREGGKFMFVGAGVSWKTLSEISKVMLWPGVLGGGKRKFEIVGMKAHKQNFERIVQWMVEGKIKPLIDSTFPMEQLRQAYERLQTGRARGKVVVRVSEDGRGPGGH